MWNGVNPAYYLHGGEEEPFVGPCVQALAAMKTRRSLANAWAVVRALVGAGWPLEVLSDEATMLRLFSERRFDDVLKYIDMLHVFESKDGRTNSSSMSMSTALRVISTWCTIASPQQIREAWSRVYPNIAFEGASTRRVKLMAVGCIAARLDEGPLDEFLHNARAHANYHVGALAAVIRSGVLDEARLVEAIGMIVSGVPGVDEQDMEPASEVLLHQARHLTEQHAERLVTVLEERGARRTQPETRLLRTVVLTYAPRRIEQWVGSLGAAQETATEALDRLSCVADHLDDGHRARIVHCLETQDLKPSALTCLVMSRHDHPESFVGLLDDALRSGPPEMRSVAVNLVPYWRDYVTEDHLEIIADAAPYLATRHIEEEAWSQLFHIMSDGQRARVADALVEAREVLMLPERRSVLSELSLHLASEDVARVVDKLRSYVRRAEPIPTGRYGYVLEALTELCNPSRVPKGCTTLLMPLLQNYLPSVRRTAYRKLLQFHELGLLA